MIAVCALGASCSVTVDPGAGLRCGEGNSCPAGQSCDNGVCVLELPRCVGAVAAGLRHTCMLRTDGTVWCWGLNDAGQLGDGTSEDSSLPVQVSGIAGATAIVAGGDHSCALVAGKVSCWGLNSSGQLGDGSRGARRTPAVVKLLDGRDLADIRMLAAGHAHTCALSTRDEVSCWGNNGGGQLGQGSAGDSVVAQAISGLIATSIAAGGNSTGALAADGTLSSWGDNRFGQLLLGDGQPDTVAAPTKVTLIRGEVELTFGGAAFGPDHGCVVTRDGEPYCAGRGSFGRLGNGDPLGGNSRVPVPAIVGDRTVAVALGEEHSCALDASARVWCWGNNASGRLGDGSETSRLSPNTAVLQDVRQLATGARHTCAVDRSGAIRCAGLNSDGQLGNGQRTTQRRPVRVDGAGQAEAIAAGNEFSCSIDGQGVAHCWGHGDHGELGDGMAATRTGPVRVSLDGIAKIGGGDHHACALTTAGTVACWGRDPVSLVDRVAPVPVDGLADVAELAVGGEHACALTTAGDVACWGRNAGKQLGDPVVASSATPILVTGLTDARGVAAGDTHSCAITDGRGVVCWGNNAASQLGDPAFTGATSATPIPVGVSDVVALRARGTLTFALRANGTVFAWGSGCHAFGVPAICGRSATPRQVTNVTAATAITGGTRVACAIDGGVLKCWGENEFGQSGNGSQVNNATPVVVSDVSGAIDVAAGVDHACAIQGDRSVVCWGLNFSGQLGDGVDLTLLPATVRQVCE